MKDTLCNGLRTPRPCYSAERREELLPIIQQVREELQSEFPEADHDRLITCGWRFESDDEVIATLESCYLQDKLFENGDELAVRDAMINCMERDYYYTFDKDYGFDEPQYDDGQEA